MTVEIQFAPPEPALPQMFEVHVDPLTGENERAVAFAGATLNSGDAEQRAALPLTALPAGYERTGRNAPCPCGSGRKFKHCHGALV